MNYYDLFGGGISNHLIYKVFYKKKQISKLMLLRRTDPCMTGDLPLSHGILTAIARLVDNDKNSVGRQSRQHSESVQATHKFIRDADGEDKAEPLQHRL